MRLSCGDYLKTGALPLLCLRCSWTQWELPGVVIQPPTVVSGVIFKLRLPCSPPDGCSPGLSPFPGKKGACVFLTLLGSPGQSEAKNP